MKSLAELEAIRKKTLERINLRKDDENERVRVVVGMATCGIAAGARPVMLSFMEEAQKRGLSHVTVSQTGCIGLCQYEPIVEVFMPGQEKVTYIKMDAEKAARVIGEHIVGGNPIAEYTVGSIR